MNLELIKKYNHDDYEEILRITNNMKNIASSIFLNKEDEEILILTGLLHKITKDPIDFLYEQNKIYEFTTNIKYVETLREIIYLQNKEHKDEDLEIYFNVLKDAQILDELYKLTKDEKIINDLVVNEKIVQKYSDNKVCSKEDVKSEMDNFLYTLSLIYELKFKYSFYTIETHNYIEKMFNNLKTENEIYQKFLKEVELIIFKYIKNKIGEKYHGW